MSLNYKEVEIILNELRPRLEGAYIQKIAQTDSLADGEAFVFHGFNDNSGAWHLMTLLKMQATSFFFLQKEQRFKMAAKPGSFVMSLRKYLMGKVIEKAEVIENERMVLLHFQDRISLLIELLPRYGNVHLLADWNEAERTGRSLASFRKVSLKPGGIYQGPAPMEVKQLEVRDYDRNCHEYFHQFIAETYLERVRSSGFEREHRAWMANIRSQNKKINTALKKVLRDHREAQGYQHFQNLGVLLTANLYQLGAQKLPDQATVTLAGMNGEEVVVPLDQKINHADNANRLFLKSKKLQRGLTELTNQKNKLEAQAEKINQAMQAVENAKSFAELKSCQALMRAAGIAVPKLQQQSRSDSARPFLEVKSQDGFRILCGRNTVENRRVTFKESKGNDIWMHVKGAPGAHVVIKAVKNKTVPLSTLLDAAQLVLQYSKLGKIRKADIDYTHRKFVRAIKGTAAEVTYAQNKTLLVELDRDRLRRIMQSAEN